MRPLLLALAALAGCSRAPITITPVADGGVSLDSGVLGHVDGALPGDQWVMPADPSRCQIGQRMWCDGLDYGTWGQVDCDPTSGKWRTRISEAGWEVLDCSESLPGGKRPSTMCGCYHFFFNPACCERPDCLVPEGTDGQICSASPRGLCDYCTPQSTGACAEPGAICIITNSHETFCGRLCDATPCPDGYTCMTVKLPGNKTTQQCVPSDLSCFF